MSITPIVENISMGGDASASRRSDWIATGGRRHICLEIALPSTGTPIGVVSVEVCNHGVAGTSGAAIPSGNLSGLTQPTGAAYSCLIDNIETTAAYVALVYTRTSGGAGAGFTDASGSSVGPKISLEQ